MNRIKHLQSFEVFIGTFNANNKNPTEDFSEWLCVDSLPDIYVIGCQEIVGLNPLNVGFLPNHSSSPWERKILETLDDQYVLLASEQLVGLLLMCFIRPHLIPYVSRCQTDTIGVGFLGVGGNKGAVKCKFRVFDTEFVFINSHLAAHDNEVANRRRQFFKVAKRFGVYENLERVQSDCEEQLGLSIQEAYTVEKSANARAKAEAKKMDKLTAGPRDEQDKLEEEDEVEEKEEEIVGETTEGRWRSETGVTSSTIAPAYGHKITEKKPFATDRYLFWFGDLNYRSHLSFAQAKQCVESNNIKALLAQDQLLREIELGQAFQGFCEGPITFRPTYKMSPGSDKYETRPSGHRRQETHSWCDRVLWLPLVRPDVVPGVVGAADGVSDSQAVQLLKYKRAELPRCSDHKAVSALFKVDYLNVFHEPMKSSTLSLCLWGLFDLLNFFLLQGMMGNNQYLPSDENNNSELRFLVSSLLSVPYRNLDFFTEFFTSQSTPVPHAAIFGPAEAAREACCLIDPQCCEGSPNSFERESFVSNLFLCLFLFCSLLASLAVAELCFKLFAVRFLQPVVRALRFRPVQVAPWWIFRDRLLRFTTEFSFLLSMGSSFQLSLSGESMLWLLLALVVLLWVIVAPCVALRRVRAVERTAFLHCNTQCRLSYGSLYLEYDSNHRLAAPLAKHLFRVGSGLVVGILYARPFAQFVLLLLGHLGLAAFFLVAMPCLDQWVSLAHGFQLFTRAAGLAAVYGASKPHPSGSSTSSFVVMLCSLGMVISGFAVFLYATVSSKSSSVFARCRFQCCLSCLRLRKRKRPNARWWKALSRPQPLGARSLNSPNSSRITGVDSGLRDPLVASGGQKTGVFKESLASLVEEKKEGSYQPPAVLNLSRDLISSSGNNSPRRSVVSIHREISDGEPEEELFKEDVGAEGVVEDFFFGNDDSKEDVGSLEEDGEEGNLRELSVVSESGEGEDIAHKSDTAIDVPIVSTMLDSEQEGRQGGVSKH